MHVNGHALRAYQDGVLGHVNGGHLTAYQDGVLGAVANGGHLTAFRDGVLGYVPGAKGYPQPMFGEGRAFADGVFSHGGVHADYGSELRAYADGVLGHVNGHPLRAYRDGSLGQEAVIGVSDAERKAAVKGYLAGIMMGGLGGLILGGVIGYAVRKK